jgi:hypothetical protein
MTCRLVRVTTAGTLMVHGPAGLQKAPPCYRCNGQAADQCDAPTGEFVQHGVATLRKPCGRWLCSSPACRIVTVPGRHLCRGCFDAAARESRAVRFEPQVLPETRS